MISVQIVTLHAGGFEVRMLSHGRSENRLCRHMEDARHAFLQLARKAISLPPGVAMVSLGQSDEEEALDRR
ncbi:MAG: hypothetical protein WC314_20835 [Vulcanimicrobiota bacterium]